MPDSSLSCATVHSRLRGAGRAPRLGPDYLTHIAHCPRCRVASSDYAWLASELAKLREPTTAEAPGAADSFIVRLDIELNRRLRRSRAIATVAGGLVVAGAAGVCTHLMRARPPLRHSH